MPFSETNSTLAFHDLPDLAALEEAALTTEVRSAAGVAAQLRLARALASVEPPRALAVAQAAARAATELGLPKEARRAQAAAGFAHIFASGFDEAAAIANDLERNGEGSLDAMSVTILRAIMRQRQGDLTGALDLALEGLRTPPSDVPEHTNERAALHNLLGTLTTQLGGGDESIAHFQRAREIMLAVGHREGVAIVSNNVGMALRENGRFDEALRCFDDALASVGTRHGGFLQAMLLGNAGLTLVEAGRLDEALGPLSDALRGVEELGILRGKGTANHNLGRLMLLRGELGRAEAYLQQARIHREAIGELLDLSDTKLQLVNLYRAMGDNEQAAALVAELLDGPSACQVMRVRAAALEARYLLLRDAGRFEAALDAHVAFHEASRAHVDDRANARQQLLLARFRHAELDHERLRERERSAAFEKLSLTDSLTGLPNRRFVETRLAGEVRRFDLRSEALCVALLDIDHFKSINDRFSHSVGDKTLQAIASLLRADIRPFDMAARLGGEEFLLAFPGNQLEQGLAACERLRIRLEANDWSACHPDLRVTASFGVVQASPGATLEKLVEAADAALYRAKNNGRNRVERALP